MSDLDEENRPDLSTLALFSSQSTGIPSRPDRLPEPRHLEATRQGAPDQPEPELRAHPRTGTPASQPTATTRRGIHKHTPEFWREVDALRARIATVMSEAHGPELQYSDLDTQRELGRTHVEHHIEQQRRELMRSGQDPSTWSPDHVADLKQAVMDALFGLGRLQPLVEIDTVENVEITGYDQVLVLHSDGRREWAPPVADSDEQLIAFLQFLATRMGSSERSFTRANPSLSLSLPPDLRLQAAAFVTPRPKIVIRRDRLPEMDLDRARELGTIDTILQAFLTAAVTAHKSIVVSGSGQGSGKTTFVRALCAAMDPWESVATIETEYELRLHQHPEQHHRVTAAEARPGSGEIGPDGRPRGEKTVSELVYDSLRFNIDRVIVGEVRGKEVLPMFQAMQMGNGSFSTIHANSAEDVIERLVTCAVQDSTVSETFAYRQVGQHIDLIVFLGAWFDPRTRRRDRFVKEVIEVSLGEEGSGRRISVNHLFRPGPDGRAVPTGIQPSFIDDLTAAGFDPTLLQHTGGMWQPREVTRP